MKVQVMMSPKIIYHNKFKIKSTIFFKLKVYLKLILRDSKVILKNQKLIMVFNKPFSKNHS